MDFNVLLLGKINKSYRNYNILEKIYLWYSSLGKAESVPVEYSKTNVLIFTSTL